MIQHRHTRYRTYPSCQGIRDNTALHTAHPRGGYHHMIYMAAAAVAVICRATGIPARNRAQAVLLHPVA
eukprot:1014836-Pyramimonas_sp.AAC.1